jgi:hypothetical protein
VRVEYASPFDLMRDPDEGPLVRPFFAGTAGPAERGVYRDWLLGRGDVRGEVLALIDALVAPVAPPDAPAIRARLAALSEQVPGFWLALMATHAGPFACGQARGAEPAVRFAFECPRRWHDLAVTGDPRRRHCDGCGETVELCETLDEAEAAARRGACITVPGRITQQAWDRYTRMMTGRPHLPEVWGRNIFGR